MNETKIIKWIILLPIAGVMLTSFIFTNVFISSKHEAHELEITNLKSTHIQNLKATIKERIGHISLLLNNNYEKQVEISKNSVKDIVHIGHETISTIYDEFKHLPKNEIYKIINDKMKNIRFFDNKSGYYFIYDLEEGTSISLPSMPSLVGSSLKNLIDKKGKNLFESYGKILNEKGEGFDTWYWNKPDSKKKLEKIGYIKKFEPLNIGIGTAVYTEDIKNTISNDIIDFIKTLNYNDNSYIFVINTNGTTIHHKNESIINVPLKELDKKIQENIRSIITKATESDGAFIEYLQSKKLFKDFIPSKKISYIKHIPILNWIIGTGLYTEDLNNQVEKKRLQLDKKLSEDIKTIITVSSFITLIVIALLILLSKRLKNIFQFYSQSLESSNKELHRLNKELERKVEEQVNDIRQKDIILNQQSKLAAMGEMLGNIAHQWRQPLSAISTLASGIRVQKEIGAIDDKQLDSDLQGIVESTKTLSNTIDDFRNFYSKDKTIHKFKFENVLNKVLNLISANLTHNEVKLVLDIKAIEINSYENELVQVILNILNNAKDALSQKDDEKYIFINSYSENEHLFIEIYDNAGGIDNKIITRVFEPYFTTKFKSQGTGIGLYMTKNIVDKSLKGKVQVENKEFTYKDKHSKGALFTIELPLSIT